MFYILMALIIMKDWEAHTVDIITDFLQVVMEDEPVIYIHPPRLGQETYIEDGQLLVWLLLRALYGLK